MEMGTVKWFNNAKGFGFICPEGGGEDIFAHYSTIQMDGYRTLKAGSRFGLMFTWGQKAIMPASLCPSKQKPLHSPLIHCVHPPVKMPARSAGIFISATRAPAHPPGQAAPHCAPGASQTKRPSRLNTKMPSAAQTVRNQFPSRVKTVAA